MSGLFWDVCAAIGATVVLIMFVSLAWFIVALCLAGVRERHAGRYVPRAWVEEERCRHHPSRWERR